MKIAIYCGSFDPMGIHHITIAKYLLKYVDQVWILPSYESFYGKNLVSAPHRIRMCELSIQSMSDQNESSRIMVQDIQIIHKLGKTYDILRKLKELYPEHIFYVALGIDNALQIQQWHHSDELITMVGFIVIPRKGYEVKTDEWFLHDPHLYISENHDNDGSSTLIRKCIKENKDLSQHVDKNVEIYIKENKLYV